jgi:hypothetical protein
MTIRLPAVLNIATCEDLGGGGPPLGASCVHVCAAAWPAHTMLRRKTIPASTACSDLLVVMALPHVEVEMPSSDTTYTPFHVVRVLVAPGHLDWISARFYRHRE